MTRASAALSATIHEAMRPLHNRTGADAYNAVCQLERRRDADYQRPMTRREFVTAALIWAVFMGTTLWLCTPAGMRCLAYVWGIGA
jgi:hypothetical protein